MNPWTVLGITLGGIWLLYRLIKRRDPVRRQARRQAKAAYLNAMKTGGTLQDFADYMTDRQARPQAQWSYDMNSVVQKWKQRALATGDPENWYGEGGATPILYEVAELSKNWGDGVSEPHNPLPGFSRNMSRLILSKLREIQGDDPHQIANVQYKLIHQTLNSTVPEQYRQKV